jgi:hypothetical protein
MGVEPLARVLRHKAGHVVDQGLVEGGVAMVGRERLDRAGGQGGRGAGRDSLDALEILGGHEALNQGDVRAMGLIERKALGERLQQAGIGDLRVGQHRGDRLQQHVNGGEGCRASWIRCWRRRGGTHRSR